MSIGTAAPATAEIAFRAAVDAIDAPRVLELGTRRWEPDRPSHHQAWVPHAAAYVKSDVAGGADVDVVADAHQLAATFDAASFDAVIAVSVFEHLARPWIAAGQLARIIKPGGVAIVATHQTFPIHGYPSDYFRFTVEALAVLFCEPDWTVVAAGYAYPCRIVPPPEVTRWNDAAEAFLNVEGCFRRGP